MAVSSKRVGLGRERPPWYKKKKTKMLSMDGMMGWGIGELLVSF